MIAVAIARDLALLAAESVLALPSEGVPDAHVSLVDGPLAERWRAVVAEVAAVEHVDATWTRLHALTGSRLSTWLAISCLACELHPEAAAAYSLLAEDERQNLVTAAAFARVATSALGVSYIDAVLEATTGSAIRLALVELVEPQRTRPLSQVGLRISRGEIDSLLGARGTGVVVDVTARREPPPEHACLDEKLVAGALAILGADRALVVRSPSARAGRQLSLEIARVRGVAATIVEVDSELPPPRELATLRDTLLVLDLSRSAGGPGLDRMVQLLACEREVVILISPRAETELPAIDVPPLDGTSSRAIWAEVTTAEQAAHLARRFRVSLDEARAAGRDAARRALVRGADSTTRTDLVDAIRARGARRMGPSVSTITTSVRLADLVVPQNVRSQIEDIVAWYRAGDRGRAALGERGRSTFGWGLTCLFSGPPGTGKTFAAQCLATELGLNLYRIDLAQVVSKYIGETEKALSRVFAEAEAGHGILLFDEADALFGKRMEIKDAHDRYANVEVGYLLQRLDEFDGVGILTTNLRNNMDAAFVRRLRFVLEFPIPDQPWRRELWEHAIPRMRADDLDLAPFVERFRLAGGSIHNIGVAVAHLAAAGDGVVTTALLVRATYRELEKSGMPRSPAEFGVLAVHLKGVVG